VDAELAVQVDQMGLDRALLHEQLSRHLGVGAPGRQQPQHFQLPLGQRLDEPGPVGPERLATDGGEQGLEEGR